MHWQIVTDIVLGLFLIFFMFRCSVDPYLFENFATNDGDFLNAQFRAFKFPESSFVMFRGTVNVCLDTCNPVCDKTIIKENI